MAAAVPMRGNALQTPAAPGSTRTSDGSARTPLQLTSSLLPPLTKCTSKKCFLRKCSIGIPNSYRLRVSPQSRLMLVFATAEFVPDSEMKVPEIGDLPDFPASEFQNPISSLTENIEDTISEAGKNISDAATVDVIESAKDALGDMQNAFFDAVENFTDATADIVDLATDSLDSLQKEASNSSSLALDFIQDAIDDAKNTFYSNGDGTEISDAPSESPSLDLPEAPIEAATSQVQNSVQDDVTSYIPSSSTDVPLPPTGMVNVDVTDVSDMLSPTVESSGDSVSFPLPSAAEEILPADVQINVTTVPKSAASKYAEMIGSSTSSQTPSSGDSGDFPDVFSAASSAVTDTLETVKHGAESLSMAIQKSLTSGPGALQDALNSYIKSLNSLQSSISSQIKVDVPETLNLPIKPVDIPSTPLPTPSLQPLTDTIQSITETTYSAAAISLGQLYNNFKDTLPSEVSSSLSQAEEKFSTVAVPAAAFVGQALKQSFFIAGKSIRAAEQAAGLNPDDPSLTLIPLLGGTIFLGFLYWKAKYGGYSGDLSPEEALQILRNEINSVLVDIRPQPVIELEGIVDLRRSARFKDAYVEYKKIENSFRRRIRNPIETELMIMAAKIYGLKGVGLNTKVLIMDSDGSQSKVVAKALQKYGFQRAYRVEGGYQAWSSSLRVKPDAPESTLQVLQQEAEAIYEEVRPTALQLSGIGMGLVLGIYAIIEWEKFFELVGVIAISQLAYNLLFVYETAEEFQEDLTEFLKTVGLYSTISPVASKLVPENSIASQSNVIHEDSSTRISEDPVSEETVVPPAEAASIPLEDEGSSDPMSRAVSNNGTTNGASNGSLSKTGSSATSVTRPESPTSDVTLIASSEDKS